MGWTKVGGKVYVTADIGLDAMQTFYSWSDGASNILSKNIRSSQLHRYRFENNFLNSNCEHRRPLKSGFLCHSHEQGVS
jgi:hypothetical protein